MKKKLTSVLLFLAMSVGVVSAQTSKVTGKVVGEDGEPVIGASIIVKGTTVILLWMFLVMVSNWLFHTSV